MKVTNDADLRKGDMLSVFKPTARQVKNPETGEMEERQPPEFLKMEIVKFLND